LRFLFVFLVIAMGCQHAPQARKAATIPLELTVSRDDAVDAVVAPPVGWKAQPLKFSSQHRHQLWLSPSGNTAYGVIFFHLPLPVGTDLALWGFLNQMKKSEGEARLISKRWDPNLGALRFEAEGGLYRIRGNLFASGLRGWVIYAGTLRNASINEKELELATLARESTRMDANAGISGK